MCLPFSIKVHPTQETCTPTSASSRVTISTACLHHHCCLIMHYSKNKPLCCDWMAKSDAAKPPAHSQAAHGQARKALCVQCDSALHV